MAEELSPLCIVNIHQLLQEKVEQEGAENTALRCAIAKVKAPQNTSLRVDLPSTAMEELSPMQGVFP